MRKGQYYIDDNKPSSTSAEDLFSYCIKKLIDKSMFDKSYMHNQWAGILFGYEKNSSLRTDYMSKIKREYSLYFTKSMKYSFIEEKIKRDFPYFWGIDDDIDEEDYTSEDLIRDTIKVVNNEIIEQKDPDNIETYKGKDLSLVRHQGKSYIYQVMLTLSDGQEPHFHDGEPFILRVFNKDTTCETVEFDYVSGRLYFTSSLYIGNASYCTILLDFSFILVGLKHRLEDLKANGVNESLPYAKFLFDETSQLSRVKHLPVPEQFKQKLDQSQRRAFEAALDHDITFIWGPPGTGKSFTLASIIYTLYQLGEDRTAICCLSNVAVDQLLCKVLDILDSDHVKINPGNIYRAGRTSDYRIIATDYLFPNDKITQGLRDKIQSNSERLKQFKLHKLENSEEAIILKAENKDLRERLKIHTESLVKSSRVVFSTISNFILSSTLYESKFQNLIIDEASMMAMPSLMTLGHKITKRLILVGDFQQLSPIAIIKDELLTDSVFKMSGIDINHTNHPALHQLLHQRRSDKKIVDLINDTFYESKLIPSTQGNINIINKEPFAGKIISVFNCEGAVRFTKGGTRQNKQSAESIIDLLDLYYQDKSANFSIGIITPYRGQVSLLKALKFEKHYSNDFEDRIKIGTIHTFQGSECDVIIIDIVDCQRLSSGSPMKNIGQLFKGDSGERLMNVAVSRARHKLIVVCDQAYIKNIPGNQVTYRTRNLFKRLGNCPCFSSLKVNNSEEPKTSNIVSEFDYKVPILLASKRFFSIECRVVFSTSGYYLEIEDKYLKLSDCPKGYSTFQSHIWIKKDKNNFGFQIVHEYLNMSHLVGYIKQQGNIISFTGRRGENRIFKY